MITVYVHAHNEQAKITRMIFNCMLGTTKKNNMCELKLNLFFTLYNIKFLYKHPTVTWEDTGFGKGDDALE